MSVRIAWAFPCDETDGGEVLTATSEVGNMLKENLVNHQPSKPWRSSSAAVQTITGRLGEAGSINHVRFLLLYAHNLSNAASIRLELAQDSAFAYVLFDETWGYSAPSTGFGVYPFGVYPFGSGAPIGGDGYNPFLLEFFDNDETVNYYRLTITDTTNTDGYIQVGRLAMGDYWQPEAANMMPGYMLSSERPGQRGRMTRNGAWRARELPRYRVQNIQFSLLTEYDEQQLDVLDFQAGDFRNVLVSGFPNATGEANRRHVMLGFMRKMDGFSRHSMDYRSNGIEIREAV